MAHRVLGPQLSINTFIVTDTFNLTMLCRGPIDCTAGTQAIKKACGVFSNISFIPFNKCAIAITKGIDKCMTQSTSSYLFQVNRQFRIS